MTKPCTSVLRQSNHSATKKIVMRDAYCHRLCAETCIAQICSRENVNACFRLPDAAAICCDLIPMNSAAQRHFALAARWRQNKRFHTVLGLGHKLFNYSRTPESQIFHLSRMPEFQICNAEGGGEVQQRKYPKRTSSARACARMWEGHTSHDLCSAANFAPKERGLGWVQSTTLPSTPVPPWTPQPQALCR